nr:cyclophilin-like fold protein [uncultured Desulfuromonas sp.]
MTTNNTINTDNALSEKVFAITLTVGTTVIPAFLNESRSARELVSRLPYTVQLHKYEHDYCGVMQEPLPYNDTDLRHGWSNGDIAFAADGGYFAILYKDEEISQQFGNLVTLGKINAPLRVMDTLDDAISVTIERH